MPSGQIVGPVVAGAAERDDVCQCVGPALAPLEDVRAVQAPPAASCGHEASSPGQSYCLGHQVEPRSQGGGTGTTYGELAACSDASARSSTDATAGATERRAPHAPR